MLQIHQICFHIAISDPVLHHQILAPVQHIFSCNRAKTMLGQLTVPDMCFA